MKAVLMFFTITVLMVSAAFASYEEALRLFDEKKYRESLKLIADQLDVKKDADPLSSNYKLRFLAAHNHWKLGTHDSALLHFQKCIQIKPDSVDPYIDAALMLSELKKYSGAENYIRKGLDIKKDAMLYYAYGKISAQTENYWKAKDFLEKTISINPELPVAYNSLGIVLMKLDRASEANTAFTAALAMNPGCSEIMNNVGYSFMSMGKFDVAVKYLEKAHLMSPENPAIKANLEFSKSRITK